MKAIDSFLECHESSVSDQSNSLQSRDRVGAVPDDVIIKLKIVRSFMGPEDKGGVVLSSSSVKIEELKAEFQEKADKRPAKIKFTDMNDKGTIKSDADAVVKLEIEEIQVLKKPKKNTDGGLNSTEKKKKSRKSAG